jgi:antitoxin PrlF
MQESTVTSKGQTTLPKDVRLALQLHAGDRVRYMILDGGEVRLVRSRPVLQLAGLLKDKTGRSGPVWTSWMRRLPMARLRQGASWNDRARYECSGPVPGSG